MNPEGIESKFHKLADGAGFRVGLPIIAMAVILGAAMWTNSRARDAAADVAAARDVHIYRTMLRAKTDAIAIEVDERGVIVWASEPAKSIGARIGRPVEDLMPEEGRERHHAGFQKALANRETAAAEVLQTIQCHIVAPDGKQYAATVETWTTPTGAMAWITLGGASDSESETGRNEAAD